MSWRVCIKRENELNVLPPHPVATQAILDISLSFLCSQKESILIFFNLNADTFGFLEICMPQTMFIDRMEISLACKLLSSQNGGEDGNR